MSRLRLTRVKFLQYTFACNLRLLFWLSRQIQRNSWHTFWTKNWQIFNFSCKCLLIELHVLSVFVDSHYIFRVCKHKLNSYKELEGMCIHIFILLIATSVASPEILNQIVIFYFLWGWTIKLSNLIPETLSNGSIWQPSSSVSV